MRWLPATIPLLLIGASAMAGTPVAGTPVAGNPVANPLPCAGTVTPGLAYPDPAGTWRGLEIAECQTLAKKLHKNPIFTPVLQDSDIPPATTTPSIIFAPQGDIPPGYTQGPTIINDTQALMVPALSPARTAKDLGHAYICVEPGAPEDLALTAYFTAHNIPLHEFVFQETDEMHDAYSAGRCDAITARTSLLIGLRANANGIRQQDRILPDILANNPVIAATPAGQPAWAKLVASTLETRNVQKTQ